MKILFFIINFTFWVEYIQAQNYNNIEADTLYYPYENNIQMIEIIFPKKHYNTISNYNILPNTIRDCTNNIYIFRNKKGKILHVYNGDKDSIEVEKLRSPKDENYALDFLLYQYTFTTYINEKTKKQEHIFVHKDKNNHLVLFNQYGKKVTRKTYHKLYKIKDDIILNQSLVPNYSLDIIFLNDLKNNLYNLNGYEDDFILERIYGLKHDFVIYEKNCLYNVLDLKTKKIFLISKKDINYDDYSIEYGHGTTFKYIFFHKLQLNDKQRTSEEYIYNNPARLD